MIQRSAVGTRGPTVAMDRGSSFEIAPRVSIASASWKRALAGRHLVQHRPEGELIRSKVDRRAARLLGRHVGDGRRRHARRRPRRRRQPRAVAAAGFRGRQLREAETQDPDQPLPGHKDVLGFQISVHDPGLVRLRQGVGHLGRDRQQSLDRKGSGRRAPAASARPPSPSRCRRRPRTIRSRGS